MTFTMAMVDLSIVMEIIISDNGWMENEAAMASQLTKQAEFMRDSGNTVSLSGPEKTMEISIFLIKFRNYEKFQSKK